MFALKIFSIVFSPAANLFIQRASKSELSELVGKNFTEAKLSTKAKLLLKTYYHLANENKLRLVHATMSEDGGVEWAHYYRSKGFPDENYELNNAYKYLSDFINSNCSKNITIHQICASSGREINFFSKQSSSIIFEASDISLAIAEDINNFYPNIKTSVVDVAKRDDLERCLSSAKMIIAFGGLQYVLPEHLSHFFHQINHHNCELIIAQPISSKVNPLNHKVSTPRGNFSWNHPYLYLAVKAGLSLKRFSTTYSPETPWAQSIYMHCSAE